MADEYEGGKTKPEEMLTDEQRQEHEKASEIAEEKLKQLLDDSFKEFAIRFVDIEEYKLLLSGEKPFSGEISRYGRFHGNSDENEQSFKEYLEQASRYWGGTVESSTNWDRGARSLRASDHLNLLFKSAHEEAQKTVDSPKEIKDKAYEIFANKLAEYLTDINNEYLGVQVPSAFEDVVFHLSEYLKTNGELSPKEIQHQLLDKAWETCDPAIDYTPQFDYHNASQSDRDVFMKSLKDLIPQEYTQLMTEKGLKGEYPENFLFRYISYIKRDCAGQPEAKKILDFLIDKDFSNIEPKEVVTAIMLLKPKTSNNDANEQRFQYQIGLVFSHDALNGLEPDYPKTWDTLKTHIPPESFMGAISCMPYKEFYQQMAALSAKAGNFTHPVFDSHGNVRYPKMESELSKFVAPS